MAKSGVGADGFIDETGFFSKEDMKLLAGKSKKSGAKPPRQTKKPKATTKKK